MEENNVLTPFFVLIDAVIKGDALVCEQIHTQHTYDVMLTDDRLLFTLPGVYAFLGEPLSCSYEVFRAALYASNINQIVKQKGYQFDMYRSTKKVDSTWYQLVRTT